MNVLDWLREGELKAATIKFKEAIAKCRDEQQRRTVRNVLDPFSMVAIAYVFGPKMSEELMPYIGVNSVVNCIGNALGRFHQDVLGSANGWENHDRGFDLISEREQKLAEVKNKHNTMNAANRREIEDGLRSAVRQKPRGWTAYLVIVIPKKPERYCHEIAPNVLETDGASFYELVSGKNNAMHDVLDHLCDNLDVSHNVADWVQELNSLPPKL